MPYPILHVPTYRHHKARGLAVVTINGKDVYLGPFNSQQSRDQYDRLIQSFHVKRHRSSKRARLPFNAEEAAAR